MWEGLVPVCLITFVPSLDTSLAATAQGMTLGKTVCSMTQPRYSCQAHGLAGRDTQGKLTTP